jgi:hypothetical protein
VTVQADSAAERIRAAMAPDPTEWSYTGEFRDCREQGGGQCTCGKAVRYQFFIGRASDGKRLAIGSTCIETSVPFLMAAGANALVRDLKQASRLVAAREDLPELRRDAAQLREWCFARRREWTARYGRERWMPRVLFIPPKPPSAAERDDETAASIRRQYTRDWVAAVECARDDGFELPPIPRNARLNTQLTNRNRRALREPGHRGHAIVRWARDAYRARLNRGL